MTLMNLPVFLTGMLTGLSLIVAIGAHSTEDGHRFHAIVGTYSTASWAAIPRLGRSGRLVHGVRPEATGQAVSW